MGKLFLFVLFGCSASICAQDRSYSLNSSFHDAQTGEFVSVDGERGRTIKGRLSGKNGVQYHIPDVCEPEGGEAELVDAYTVKGKERKVIFYLLVLGSFSILVLVLMEPNMRLSFILGRIQA